MESHEPWTYDVFTRGCPSITVLETLSSKWVYLLIVALRPGRQRYSELQRRVEGVSPKMLTQTLRLLERDGLLTRTVFPTVPPRVEYELTPLGRDLAGLMDQVRRWGEAHVPEIVEARTRFDAA